MATLKGGRKICTIKVNKAVNKQPEEKKPPKKQRPCDITFYCRCLTQLVLYIAKFVFFKSNS